MHLQPIRVSEETFNDRSRIEPYGGWLNFDIVDRTLIRQVFFRGESFRSTDCLAVNRKTESQKRKNDKTCKCRVMWVPYNHSVYGGFRLCDWVMFLDSRWYSLMFIDFRHDFDRRGGSYFRPPDEMSVHNPNSVPDEMCIVTLHPPPVRRDVSAQRQLCRTKCVCPVSAVPSEACCAQRNVNSHDAPHPCSEMCMPNANHCV